MKHALLTLTVDSSFEGGYTISLFKEYELESVHYSLHYEESWFPYSKPTLLSPKEVTISAEEVEHVLVLLTHSCTVFKVEPIVGLDGTTFELRIADGFTGAHYKWWCGLPEGWEALGEIANALLRLAGREETIE
jgi:hypothetical protein